MRVIVQTRLLVSYLELVSMESGARFLHLSIDFFRLGQFSSFRHKLHFCFDAGSYNSLVTVAVSYFDESLAPDSMETSSK